MKSSVINSLNPEGTGHSGRTHYLGGGAGNKRENNSV